VAALATAPLPVQPSITATPRYRRLVEEFGLTAQQQLTCGCHVHVEIDSAEEGVAILDRIRGWLPPLLALSANSPFWQGADTGYASFRSQVWARWPSAGSTEVFGSAEAYHATVQTMIDSGTILDEGMVYFDARLSRQHPTLEVRVADVCLLPDDAVLLAALVRGLADTAARAWRAGEPPTPLRVELLRLAAWRAGRSGLDGDLLGPTGKPVSPAEIVRALIQHVSPALDESGDLDVVEELATTLLQRGNGANIQRDVYRKTGHLPDVVKSAVQSTGCP
ncbi:MAG: glutamate--cysteine ligase, partial [Pseudonocardiaceae bacterium]